MEKTSISLNHCHVQRTEMIINRLYMFFLGIALLALFYYRTTNLFQIIKNTREIPLLPHLLIFTSELLLTFLYVLHQAFRWRPVVRKVYPDRLPQEDEDDDRAFPPIDVFACTADPSKEPSLGVMNTVVSAMALDYPPDHLSVYLSDDGGSSVTLDAMREAWRFSKWWLPFCRKYQLKNRCPGAHFSSAGSGEVKFVGSTEFVHEEMEIKKRYDDFKESLAKKSLSASNSVSRDHESIIEVMNDEGGDAVDSSQQEMPTLVYVSREKRPSHQHHFKAGAINALRRWLGVDGIGGPCISGCNTYIKREALYGTANIKTDFDFNDMKKSFGPSNELIKSIYKDYKPRLPKDRKVTAALENEVQLLASCVYDGQSEWGKEVGFIYTSVVEDVLTGEYLHCQGRTSVWIDPPRPCFLGSCPTNLSDVLAQQARWGLGLMQISLSKYCPLLYGRGKMSTLQCMSYAALSFDPIYVVPFYGLAIVPQKCLLNGIPLYPKVSEPFFVVFIFIFLMSQLKHVQEAVSYGDSIKTSLYELRMWMMKSASCYLYATLGAFLDKLGLRKAHFTLTNKVVDDEQDERFKKGVYDFQGSPMLFVPICSLYILNLASFIIGIARITQSDKANELFVQALIPLFGIIVNYHVFEGMVLRNDKGRISPYVSLLSLAIATFLLCFGSLVIIL